MRRLSIGIAIVFGIGLADAAPAPPPSAQQVLANVQRYYANARQLGAKFHQIVTNKTFGTTRASDGRLWAAKPAQLRFEYVQQQHGQLVPVKVFISDGTTLWFVDRPNLQIYKQSAKQSALPGAVAFLLGGSALDSEFAVSLAKAGEYGDARDVALALVPKQASVQYKRLVFVIDPTDWHVKESIVDGSDSTSDFVFSNVDTRSDVPASTFTFTPAALPTYKVIIP